MRQGDCVHFTGIQHDTCAAGVEYEALRKHGPRLPCLQSLPRPIDPAICPKFRAMTADEEAAERAQRDARVAKLLEDLSAGRCPTCGQPIEPSRLVGRCIYSACGHRLGQAR